MIIAGALPAAVLGSALLSHPVNLFAESFARLISVSITPIHHTDGRSHLSVLSKLVYSPGSPGHAGLPGRVLSGRERVVNPLPVTRPTDPTDPIPAKAQALSTSALWRKSPWLISYNCTVILYQP